MVWVENSISPSTTTWQKPRGQTLGDCVHTGTGKFRKPQKHSLDKPLALAIDFYIFIFHPLKFCPVFLVL